MNKYEIELRKRIKGSGLTIYPSDDPTMFFIGKPSAHINSRSLIDVKNKKIISNGSRYLTRDVINKYFGDYALGEGKMNLTSKQKQLVKEYIQKLQKKPLIKESEYSRNIKELINSMQWIDNDEIILLLTGISKYYRTNADELTNQNVIGIAKHLDAAADLIKNRTSN